MLFNNKAHDHIPLGRPDGIPLRTLLPNPRKYRSTGGGVGLYGTEVCLNLNFLGGDVVVSWLQSILKKGSTEKDKPDASLIGDCGLICDEESTEAFSSFVFL